MEVVDVEVDVFHLSGVGLPAALVGGGIPGIATTPPRRTQFSEFRAPPPLAHGGMVRRERVKLTS